MTTEFIIVLLIAFLVAQLGALTYKIYQFVKKFNKLYNYFIRSEKDLSKEGKMLKSTMRRLPPMNGECPTKEELEELDNIENP